MASSPISANVRVRDRDLGWNKVLRELCRRGKGTVTVGVHGEQDGRGDGNIGNVALAAVHEFGKTIQHPGGTPFAIIGGRLVFMRVGSPFTMGVTDPHPIVIPERSFIRSTIDRNLRRYQKLTRTLGGKIYEGKLKRPQALDLLGLKVVADMQSTITRGVPPPNKASTVRRKGSSKPLVYRRFLLRSIKHKVND